tara:strand:+ start:278 stop:400 length:123 start_codon:yes stop_codon:yes gene_type:complete
MVGRLGRNKFIFRACTPAKITNVKMWGGVFLLRKIAPVDL